MGLEKGMRQRTLKIRPFPKMDDRQTILAKREGGAHDLPVWESQPGIFTSAWAIHQRDVRKFLKDHNWKAVITLVVDTNVPGHPTVSMAVQEIEVIPD